jgi:FixJ family two-component response regulator
MTSTSPLIHVVEDDEAFRTALSRLLTACGYDVAVYESGDQFLAELPCSRPGCILLDLRMSGLSGLELQERLSAEGCGLPVIFLTGHGEVASTVQAMKGGAEDYLTKPVTKVALLEVLERALRRDQSGRVARAEVRGLRTRLASLTNRERDVFALVVRGKMNKQIAHDLGTSERTIKAHRHSIVQKLQVRSAAELTSIAERLAFTSHS